MNRQYDEYSKQQTDEEHAPPRLKERDKPIQPRSPTIRCLFLHLLPDKLSLLLLSLWIAERQRLDVASHDRGAVARAQGPLR